MSISRPQPAAAGEAALAAALLAPDSPAPGDVADARRFAVYRNNVVVGLIDAIVATYPAVLALVSETFFRAATREFVLQNPPTSPVLIHYGAAFPAWIEAFPPAASVPYLGDVARIEWAWNRAYNAAEATPLDVSCLGATPPDALASARPALHPSLSLVRSGFPALSLWAHATGRMASSDLDLSMPEIALIVRPADTVDVRTISSDMAGLLDRIAAGDTIAAAAAGFDGDQAALANCLAAIFQLGLVVGLTAPGAETQETCTNQETCTDQGNLQSCR